MTTPARDHNYLTTTPSRGHNYLRARVHHMPGHTEMSATHSSAAHVYAHVCTHVYACDELGAILDALFLDGRGPMCKGDT